VSAFDRIQTINCRLFSFLEVPKWVYCVEKLDDEVSDIAVLISVRGLHSG